MVEKKPHIVNISDLKNHDPMVCGIDLHSDCFDCVKDRARDLYDWFTKHPELGRRIIREIERERNVKAVDWKALQKRFSEQLTPTLKTELANMLGVSELAVNAFGTGWNGRAWTTPMVDSSWNLCGMARRFRDGTKPHLSGSRAGISFFVPRQQPSQIILVPEGVSDGMAAFDLGFGVVCRVSALGFSVQGLVAMLKRYKPETVIAIGDRDKGSEAGQQGLVKVFNGILPFFPDVRTWLPPEPYKDLRQWANDGGTFADLLCESQSREVEAC